jgi:glycosyltransferase involved in cell wall biosynthesis
MRILIIRPLIDRGGAPRVIIQLVQGLQLRGVDVVVASMGGEWLPGLEQIAPCYHIPLHPSSIRNIFRSLIMLRKIVRAEKIDLINSHHRFSGLVSNLYSLFAHTPVVSTVHEIKYDRAYISRLTIGKFAIVFSQAVKEHVMQVCGLSSDHVFQVPIGITIQPPKLEDIAKICTALELSDQLPVIACIARFSEEKGCSIYLQAVAKVIESGHYAQFLLVGDGPLKNELVRACRNLHLEDHVRIIGWREDVSTIIAISKFLVLPSFSEALGITILEGYLLGKTTIASDVGGIPEIIHNNQNGLLVPPGDPHQLARAIISMLEKPYLAEQFGQIGKQQTLTQFTPDQMVDQTIKAYEAVRRASR